MLIHEDEADEAKRFAQSLLNFNFDGHLINLQIYMTPLIHAKCGKELPSCLMVVDG